MGGQTDKAQARHEYDTEKLYRVENRGTTQNMGNYGYSLIHVKKILFNFLQNSFLFTFTDARFVHTSTKRNESSHTFRGDFQSPVV